MQILTDLRQNVGITALTGLRLINRYDVQGVSEAEFRPANTTSGQTAPPSVFSCSLQENVPG